MVFLSTLLPHLSKKKERRKKVSFNFANLPSVHNAAMYFNKLNSHLARDGTATVHSVQSVSTVLTGQKTPIEAVCVTLSL